MLRDIRAFFVTGTDRRMWWNMAHGLVAGVAAVRAGLVVEQGAYPVGSAVFLGIGLAGIVWNTVLGPGCAVYVVTGVQSAKLPALTRLKKARRILARVQPMIVDAQSDLVLPSPGPATLPEVAPLTPPPT